MCARVCACALNSRYPYQKISTYLFLFVVAVVKTTVDLMKAWEETKIQFDPSEMQDDTAHPVRINLAALVGDGVLGGRALQSCVDAYNRTFGGNLTLKRGTTVLMPLVQATSLFKKVIDKIIHLVKELLVEKPMQYIYLVGGFAESKMLHKRVVAEFESRDLRVIVPMRPQVGRKLIIHK